MAEQIPELIEMNGLEQFQSITDSTQLLGYSPSAEKYGLIAVGKIRQTSWCGCRWAKDSLTCEGEPVGSIPKIEVMADLFGLGGYLVQNDHTRRKLSRENHNTFADGNTASLNGSMGHYQWGSGVTIYYATWEDDSYVYEAVDTVPIPGQLNYRIPVFSRSCAGYATIDRTTNTLVSYINQTARYRGGSNDASKDGTWATQLGMPATNIAVPTAVTYARKNGELWFCNERVVFFITAALKRIYFHNRNIQAGFTSSLTAEGLHRGGTGEGASRPADWATDWGNHPYIPLSAGVDQGDMTGTFSQMINDNGTTRVISGIPSFLGLKNDYKYLLCIEGDAILQGVAGKSQAMYVDLKIDGHIFDASTVAGKTFVGTTPAATEAGWKGISRQSLTYLAQLPTECSGSATTGYGDSYYNPAEESGLRGIARLGLANNGSVAGSACLYGSSAPGAPSASYGVVLCEFKEAFSTEPTMYS